MPAPPTDPAIHDADERQRRGLAAELEHRAAVRRALREGRIVSPAAEQSGHRSSALRARPRLVDDRVFRIMVRGAYRAYLPGGGGEPRVRAMAEAMALPVPPEEHALLRAADRAAYYALTRLTSSPRSCRVLEGHHRGLASGRVRRKRLRARNRAWADRHAAGESCRAIAAAAGVQPSTVSRALRAAARSV